MRLLLFLVTTLVFSPRLAHGQVDPDSVRRRNNCRLAEQVISIGHPEPRTEWAWQYIGFCEPSRKVRVYRAAIQQARTSTDTTLIFRAILPAVGLRDGVLFREVVEVAGDRSASVPARVIAFVALAAIRNPNRSPSYDEFIGGLDENGIPRRSCSARRSHPYIYDEGPTPLPADYLKQIENLSSRVRLDPSQPADVRSAAACT
jgi:hypothetical protein